MTRFWHLVVCISLVPSVTNHVVSITSCVVVQVVRGMPVLPASTCRWKDALMRIFASDRVSGMMRKLGMKPGEAIEHHK